jgi:hypothetical protein
LKLSEITNAALAETPNLEVDIVRPDGSEVQVVFRNLILVPEEERAKFTNTEVKKILEAKGKTSGVRKEADAAKVLLKSFVLDKSHIDLLEDIFTAIDAETPGLSKRDVSWIALLAEYGKATHMGEAKSSQES